MFELWELIVELYTLIPFELYTGINVDNKVAVGKGFSTEIVDWENPLPTHLISTSLPSYPLLV